MLDGQDDVEALMRVFDGLCEQLDQQREHVNDICQLADQVGGVEPLSVPDLELQLKRELNQTQATMSVLDNAEQSLEQVMELLRKFAHAQTVKSLSLHRHCIGQVDDWTNKANNAYIEQMKLQEQAAECTRKISNLAAYLL